MDTATEFDFKFENLREWAMRTKTHHGRNKLKQLGSPTEVQKQNLVKVLIWVYQWGYASAEVISNLLGRANRSHSRRLTENGWLRKVALRGCPIYYILTDKGLALAQNQSTFDDVLPPAHIKPANIEHDLAVQVEVLKALSDGWFNDYLTPRMYDYAQDGGPRKIPDAILLRRVPGTFEDVEVIERTWLEVELNAKYEARLDLFAANTLRDIEDQHCARSIIVSNSKAVFQHYPRHFKPGKQIKLWNTSKNKTTDTGQVYEVKDWTPKYVFFRQLGSTIPYHYES